MIKMLIVDDNDDARKYLRTVMELVAAEVMEASDGHRALKIFHKKHPNIVLLDVMLPGGVSGFDVCREIRASDGLQPKIIIISALGRLGDQYEGFEAGADEYLIKPFSPLALIEIVNEMVRRVRGTQFG